MPPYTLNTCFPSTKFKSIIHHFEWIELKDNAFIKEEALLPCFASGLLFFFYKSKPISAINSKIEKVSMPSCALLPPSSIITYNTDIHQVITFRVIFEPGAISQIYGTNMRDFKNLAIDTSKEMDPVLSSLRQNMLEELTFKNCVDLFEDYLSTKLRFVSTPKIFKILENGASKLGYKTTAEELASTLGSSKRNLNRHINKELGISAKEFLSIRRFCGVLEHMQKTLILSLAQVAPDFGYYDQSHLSNEFKQMSGMTPKQFLNSIGGQDIPENTEIDFQFSGIVSNKR